MTPVQAAIQSFYEHWANTGYPNDTDFLYKLKLLSEEQLTECFDGIYDRYEIRHQDLIYDLKLILKSNAVIITELLGRKKRSIWQNWIEKKEQEILMNTDDVTQTKLNEVTNGQTSKYQNAVYSGKIPTTQVEMSLLGALLIKSQFHNTEAEYRTVAQALNMISGYSSNTIYQGFSKKFPDHIKAKVKRKLQAMIDMIEKEDEKGEDEGI